MCETILVTGSTGFIGQRLVKHLLDNKIHVKVLLRPESQVTTLPHGVEGVRASFSDITSLSKVVQNVDRVVHLAGVTKALNEAGYDAGNVLPTENLCKAISSCNSQLKRFLHVSSLAAAGPASEGVYGVRELDAALPVSAYGQSKLRGEQACLRYSSQFPVTIVRPPAVYGPGDKDVLQVFQMLAKGILIAVGSANKQRFSMIYVDDLVHGIMNALYAERAVGQIYYMTSPVSYGWNDVIEAARPYLHFKNVRTISLPKSVVFLLGTIMGSIGALRKQPMLLSRDKAHELVQRYWVCSPKKAIEELGFTAPTSLAKGVEQTVRWYQQQGWL